MIRILLGAIGIGWLLASLGAAEVLYVDARQGSDANPGTQERPLASLADAADRIRRFDAPGPTEIRIAPGRYPLAETVLLACRRAYSEKDRLTLRAAILPDDPNWIDQSMPTILSIQQPERRGAPGSPSETYGIQVRMNHVTLRGLRFLGSAVPYNMYCPVERVGKDLTDLEITQCVFAGDPNGLDIYCAALATGDRFVVDHCRFRRCQACVVYWDGPEQIAGRQNAMQYCIVDQARMAAVWTCQTAEDLAFHNNIILRSNYVWMRKPQDRQVYRWRDCVLAQNAHESGYGLADGPLGPTGPEVRFLRQNVRTMQRITRTNDPQTRTGPLALTTMPEGDLGAGLFLQTNRRR
ncbi:MAG: hypothetical protein JW810_12445 [Sedimentisphaerales bacterium]|nr:hypothetical protein [Sedimentisphaerales bacterium]